MCKYCETTNVLFNQLFQIDNNVINHGDLTGIITNLRMDIRPEDDLYQLDIELVEYDNKGNAKSDFSDNCVDINYCPFCGRQLRAFHKAPKQPEQPKIEKEEDTWEKIKENLDIVSEKLANMANFKFHCDALKDIIKEDRGVDIDVESILNIYIAFNQGLNKEKTTYPYISGIKKIDPDDLSIIRKQYPPRESYPQTIDTEYEFEKSLYPFTMPRKNIPINTTSYSNHPVNAFGPITQNNSACTWKPISYTYVADPISNKSKSEKELSKHNDNLDCLVNTCLTDLALKIRDDLRRGNF